MQQMGVPHVFLDIRVGREHLKHLMDLNIDTVPVLFKPCGTLVGLFDDAIAEILSLVREGAVMAPSFDGPAAA